MWAAPYPFLEDEGSGADRVRGELLAVLLGCRGGDHESDPLPQHAHQRGKRSLEPELDGVIVEHVDRVDHRKKLLALRRADLLVEPLVDVPLHRGGVEVGAVVELHVLPEMEDDALAAVFHVPALGELGVDGEVRTELRQGVVDEIEDLTLGELHREHRVHGLGVRRKSDGEGAAAHRGLGLDGRHAHERGRRDRHDGVHQAHRSWK